MSRRAVSLAFIILALVAAGECLLCYVCIPSMKSGDTGSKQAAAKMRANITRTFPGKAESDFQECNTFVKEQESAQAPCPWNDDSVVCMHFKHSAWDARSCGRVPFDADLICNTGADGEEGCPCAGALCNGGPDRRAPAALGTLLVTAAAIRLW